VSIACRRARGAAAQVLTAVGKQIEHRQAGGGRACSAEAAQQGGEVQRPVAPANDLPVQDGAGGALLGHRGGDIGKSVGKAGVRAEVRRLPRLCLVEPCPEGQAPVTPRLLADRRPVEGGDILGGFAVLLIGSAGVSFGSEAWYWCGVEAPGRETASEAPEVVMVVLIAS
jgi:hypothetical protein